MADQRPWLANYPDGIPANINPDAFPTLVAMFEETFEKYRKHPAFTCMDATLTFDQLDKQSRQFGGYLLSRGLEPGDRIALMMPNLLQYPIALFGALRAGLIVVNTNPLYTYREMQHQFNDSGVKAIVIVENFAAELQKIIADTKIKTVVLTSIGELLGSIKGTLTNFVVRKVKKLVPAYQLDNTVSFKEALSLGKKFKLPPLQGGPEDVILYQYTGGTTGVAKGAMLTNRNLLANMAQIRATMLPILQESKEIGLSPLPMYHIFAFTVNCLALMSIGTHTILIVNPRDLGTINSAIKKYKPTVMTGVNTLFNGLINNKDFQQLEHHLKVTSGGGMAVQRVVAEQWKKITGCALSEGYGMTESSPVASSNPVTSGGKIGTIGMPLPSTDMRIVDDNGQPLGIDEIGEIQIKGPQVMKGYYNRPEDTAACLSADGWLSTGDIGAMDSEGYFRIVDRKKDMILVSGFNVYPNEVEDTIASHPKVLEVAAVGVPDERSGEVVKVFVVKKDKSLTEQELKDWCKAEMTGYKKPRHVEFRDELPKSNVGKILRRELRQG